MNKGLKLFSRLPQEIIFIILSFNKDYYLYKNRLFRRFKISQNDERYKILTNKVYIFINPKHKVHKNCIIIYNINLFNENLNTIDFYKYIYNSLRMFYFF